MQQFLFSDNDNLTITQDAVKSAASTTNHRESEASFYSLYTAGSSLSIDLDIWEAEVGVGEEVKNKRKHSKCSNVSKDESEKTSKGYKQSWQTVVMLSMKNMSLYFIPWESHVRIACDEGSNGSYNEFCKDTLTWLEEDVFCASAPKATVDSFEDDEIVSSFSKFNQLMEKLKETKMSDLSDFDDKQDEVEPAIVNQKLDTKKDEDLLKIQTNSSSDNTSNSSSADQVLFKNDILEKNL